MKPAVRKVPLLSSCTRGCHLRTVIWTVPCGSLSVSRCSLSSKRQDIWLGQEGNVKTQFLQNMGGFDWERAALPTTPAPLFQEPGLVRICIRKATNKLCQERKILHVLPPSKLKTSSGRGRFQYFFNCNSNVFGNLGHLKPFCILTHLICTRPHKMSIVIIPNLQRGSVTWPK